MELTQRASLVFYIIAVMGNKNKGIIFFRNENKMWNESDI